MKFALLYSYDPRHAGPSEGEVSEWIAFDEKVKKAGAFVYEAGFHSASAARSLQVREGQATSSQERARGTPSPVCTSWRWTLSNLR